MGRPGASKACTPVEPEPKQRGHRADAPRSNQGSGGLSGAYAGGKRLEHYMLGTESRNDSPAKIVRSVNGAGPLGAARGALRCARPGFEAAHAVVDPRQALDVALVALSREHRAASARGEG